MVFILYTLLVLAFLLGGLSHKFRYMDILGVLGCILFFIFMPLVFYHSGYDYTGNPSGIAYFSEMVVGRTFAILNHFGEPIRTLVIIQPMAYLAGKMCFEIYKTLKS